MYLPFLIDPTIALMLLYCPLYVAMLLYHPLFSSKRYFSKYFHDNYQIFYCSTCPQRLFSHFNTCVVEIFSNLILSAHFNFWQKDWMLRRGVFIRKFSSSESCLFARFVYLLDEIIKTFLSLIGISSTCSFPSNKFMSPTS